MSHFGFDNLEKVRRCQVFNTLGSWDQALALILTFGMVMGNRGCGLETYAQALHDAGHQLLFVRHAHDGVTAALGKGGMFDRVYPHAFEHLASAKNRIDSLVPALDKIKIHDHP